MAIVKVTDVELAPDNDKVTVHIGGLSMVVRSVQGAFVANVPPAPGTPPVIVPSTPPPIPVPPELAGLSPPTKPGIVREVPVSTDAEARTEAARPGTRLLVRADLSAISIGASDIEIQAGTWRCGRLTSSRPLDRVAVLGGRWTGVDVTNIANWLFSAMMFDAPGYAFKVIGARRVTFAECSGRAQEYSIWLQGPDTGPQAEDIVVDRCRFASIPPTPDRSQSTIRLTHVVRAAIVNCRLENPIKHNYRVHGRSDLVFASNNTLVGGGIMLGAGMSGDDLGTAWFQHNKLFNTTPDLSSNLGGRRLVITDNETFRDDGRQLVAPRAGWETTGNTTQLYHSPPA